MNANKRKLRILLLLILSVGIVPELVSVAGQSGAPGGSGASLPEVIEAIEKARVTTRILYVTAHPDDEPGAVLSYLARGLHAEVALLCLTRGEGGQNAIGPEQAPQLGVIRTDELSKATQVYGTRLFFTRAADFGYSKTPEEAMRVWGQPVLEDMVRVIRTFRPQVIVNSWGGVRTGHGHHQAAGLLTPKAYELAADTKAFSEQIQEGLRAWKAEALLQLSRGDPTKGFPIPVNEVSPLWGRTWGELGLEGLLNQRSQGVGFARGSPFFRRAIALVSVDGAEANAELLGTPLSGMAQHFPNLDDSGFFALLKKVEEPLTKAEASALELDWKASAQEIARAGHELESTVMNVGGQNRELAGDVMREMRATMRRIDRALAMAAGIRIDAQADRSEVVAGESFQVNVNWQKRGDAPAEIEGVSLLLPTGWNVTKEEKQPTGGVRFTVAIPKDAKTGAGTGAWIFPWPAALVKARLKAKVGEHEFETEAEVTATRVTSVSAETRPVELVPAVTLTVEPKQMVLLSDGKGGASGGRMPYAATEKSGQKVRPEREIVVRLRHYATSAEKITAGIEAPAGWTMSPTQTVEFSGAGDQLVRFMVQPPTKSATGKYELKAWASRENGEEFRTSLEPLPSLPTRMWSEPAVAKVQVMDVRVPNGLQVGYVAAENDPIPQALRDIGIYVDLLDEAGLAFGNLSKYDAICIGIRAYELRQDLPRANPRLVDYAAAGGTLVVQYQREGVWNAIKPAPYSATASSQRTTDENSPVRIPEPTHPVLNFPNAIRAEDYQGWVQERGLYYWDKFDAKYTPILALRDPGEEEALGALVYARTGKGVYIYTGLSFFRQLPEGVAGAYRLFVNLLSQGKAKK
jgi:LmbE family N-acetylglucosaminyl deacetylase